MYHGYEVFGSFLIRTRINSKRKDNINKNINKGIQSGVLDNLTNKLKFK